MELHELTIEDFIRRLEGFSEWEKTEQVDYIVYYLTEVEKRESVLASDIQKCFEDADIKQYARLAVYLSENASSSKGRYIKKQKGYKLEFGKREEIRRRIENEPEKIEVSKQLSELTHKIKSQSEKEFLLEALNCYKVQAFRAFIVMVWIATRDHLARYIFKERLSEFNQTLSLSPNKKVEKIVKLDDFGALAESKFIELLKSTGIISSDVRKILDEKLGIRNSAAHPSGVEITGHKATEFALDLIRNVLLKY